MGRIYSWYVSTGTIKITIHEMEIRLQIETDTDDFIKQFPGIEFIKF